MSETTRSPKRGAVRAGGIILMLLSVIGAFISISGSPAAAWGGSVVVDQENCDGWAVHGKADPSGTDSWSYNPASSGDWSNGDTVHGLATVTWSDSEETYTYSFSVYKPDNCKPPETTAPPTTRPPHKVWICHVPPGNPGNAHAIEVDENGWDGHDAHHDDFLIDGPDDADCPPSPPTTTTPPTTQPPTTTAPPTTAPPTTAPPEPEDPSGNGSAWEKCPNYVKWSFTVTDGGDYDGADLMVQLLQNGSVVAQQGVMFSPFPGTESGTFSGVNLDGSYQVRFELTYEFTIPLALEQTVYVSADDCQPPTTTAPPTTAPPTTQPPVTTAPPTTQPPSTTAPPTTAPPTTAPPTTVPPGSTTTTTAPPQTTVPPTTAPPTTQPPTPPPDGDLPKTGGSTTDMTLLLAAIVFGLGLMLTGASFVGRRPATTKVK